MKIEAVEFRRVGMPLVRPFRTSFGTQNHRDILLIRVITPEVEGWGECVAMSEPLYSSETADGAKAVLVKHFLPDVFALPEITVTAVEEALSVYKGHYMARAALEMALLDAELRIYGRSLASFLGSVRPAVDSGVSVGIANSIEALLDEVGTYLDAGYMRIKLKIQPGWDVNAVAAVREKFGDDLLLQVDANTAYTLADSRHLAKLDDYNLLLIEQPLEEDDILGHAALAERISTPVCLDESITSARVAAAAISLGACEIVNIKPGRVGGYLEARRIHDVCAANGVPVWCGGMLETGIGRAANVALASLPNFTLPGDTSASDRYYKQDLTEPFVLRDSRLDVPSGPGLGVTVIPEVLEKLTTEVELVRP